MLQILDLCWKSFPKNTKHLKGHVGLGKTRLMFYCIALNSNQDKLSPANHPRRVCVWFEQTLIEEQLVKKLNRIFGDLSCSAGPRVTQIPEFSHCLTDPSGRGWTGNSCKSWAQCSCLGRAVGCTTGSKSLVRTCGSFSGLEKSVLLHWPASKTNKSCAGIKRG